MQKISDSPAFTHTRLQTHTCMSLNATAYIGKHTSLARYTLDRSIVHGEGLGIFTQQSSCWLYVATIMCKK